MTKTDTSNLLNDFSPFLTQGNSGFSNKIQTELAKDFLQHYFSPWQGSSIPLLEPPNIKQIEETILEQFQTSGGWGANRQMYSSSWWKNLAHNTNLKNFPSLQKPAITIRDIQSRLFPTEAPVFKQWTADNSNGYPFDRLQQSFIPANTPILVHHSSSNGAWLLITCASFFAWVKRTDIAWVSPAFIRQWQTGEYVVANQDYSWPNFDLDLPALELRMGHLYPVQRKLVKGYELCLASPKADNYAVIKTISCTTNSLLSSFPIKITTKNIAKIAAQMLGDPYGWGGMYGYRDCSATMMDLWANFGVWLPRNSQDQANLLPGISLIGKTRREKITLINQYALPFLTLIHFPGHVGLYLGQHKNQHYFFHNAWSASGTVIMSLDHKEKDGESFLDSADKLMSHKN